MGHHGNDGSKGHYSESSGHKGSHHDGGHKYGANHAAEHGEKGAKYGDQEQHKKGHKTTGFHNIYHKVRLNLVFILKQRGNMTIVRQRSVIVP